MQKKRFLYLLLPIVALILELLPWGVVVISGDAAGTYRSTYSYFHLGYHWLPPIVGLLTCLVLVMLAVWCGTGKHTVAVGARNLLLVAAVVSLWPLLLGAEYFTVISVAVTLVLAVSFITMLLAVKE